MKSLEAAEFVARMFHIHIEGGKLTGAVDVHIDCSQGNIRKVTVSIDDVRRSKFEISDGCTEATKVAQMK